MKSIKRFVKTLAVLTAVTVVMCSGQLAFAFFDNGYEYLFNQETGEMEFQGLDKNTSGAFTVPAYVGAYPVTSIGSYAFYDCNNINSITIPDTVKVINQSAITSCDSLTEIYLGKSVESIDSSNFGDCRKLMKISVSEQNNYFSSYNNTLYNKDKTQFILCPVAVTNIQLYNGVKEIKSGAFSNCNKLTKIDIPDSVIKVCGDAIKYCENLAEVSLGVSLSSISSYELRNCPKLTKIIVSENNSCYSSYDNALYNKDKSKIIRCPEGKTAIQLFNGVKVIPQWSFYYCNYLTEVPLPNSVERIEQSAFEGCVGLKKVIIPDSVRIIESNAYCFCMNITEILIGKSVETIGRYAFGYSSKLTSLTVPDSVNYIGSGAFSTEYYNTFPNGPVYLGKVLCNYNGEMPVGTKLIIKDGTKGIAGSALLNQKNLAEISIPNSVKEIGEGAFCDCEGLKAITIPDGITCLRHDVLNGCTNLETVVIPDSVIKIEIRNFWGSKWLNNQAPGVIYAGKVVLEYKGEITGDTSIEIKDGTKSIADCAFSDNYYNGFPAIVLPESVEYIGNCAFKCVTITITNPNTVFGGEVFENATITSDPGSTAQKYAYENDYEWIPLSLVLGDTDLNGKVGVEDARLALRNAVGLEVLNLYAVQCGDLDENGVIEIEEARTILRRAVGLE